MTPPRPECDATRLDAFLRYQDAMRAFLRTQHDVIGAYLRGSAAAAPRSTVAAAGPESAPAAALRAPRCIPSVEAAPYADTDAPPHAWPPGVLAVTGDTGGALAALQTALADTPTDLLVLDDAVLESRDAIRAALDTGCKPDRPLVGILHLAPLRPAPAFPDISDTEWAECLNRDVRGALFLLQAAAPELAASRHNAFLFAAFTSGADAFVPGPAQGGPHPWRGGLAGLLRCAAKEWPGARICTVDVDPANAARLAALVPREWAAAAPVEIGLRGDARLTIEPRRAECTADNTAPGSLHTVLVTGGARGITAECVHELALTTPARFILVGRSAVPDADEPAATRAITDPARLRAGVAAEMQARGEKPVPKTVAAEVKRRLGAREIRATLARVRETGAEADYVSCDVRDRAAFAALIRAVQERHGPIDGLLHGAGIIEDKLIVDKTAESFARVMGTKLDPLLTLVRELDWSAVRFCMLFASIAGSFGNPGQGDYGAANEIMNRLASALRPMCPGRVVAVNWGPWGGGGMVTEEVARQFAERGVGLVPPEGGRRIARDELPAGRMDARIIVGDGLWIADANRRAVRDGLARSLLLHTGRIMACAEDRLHLSVSIGTEAMPMLADHAMDGHPVLPLMFALELMAEAASLASFGRRVSAVHDLRLYRGVVVADRVQEVDVIVERQAGAGSKPAHPNPTQSGQASAGTDRWSVVLRDPANPGRPFYAAGIVTGAWPADAVPALEGPEPDGAFPKSAAEAYRDWLFHGPAFQRITAIPRFGPRAADAGVEPACDDTAETGPRVCFDPILLDTIPQLATLWSRACFNTFPLPNRVAAFHAFGPLGSAPLTLRLRLDPASNATVYKADAQLERDGTVLWAMRGLEGAGSRDLNRLTRQP
jgi:NAD(P)-dependent dehydrogenase (short-subunit alcohol dehydrogenase family)